MSDFDYNPITITVCVVNSAEIDADSADRTVVSIKTVAVEMLPRVLATVAAHMSLGQLYR